MGMEYGFSTYAVPSKGAFKLSTLTFMQPEEIPVFLLSSSDNNLSQPSWKVKDWMILQNNIDSGWEGQLPCDKEVVDNENFC